MPLFGKRLRNGPIGLRGMLDVVRWRRCRLRHEACIAVRVGCLSFLNEAGVFRFTTASPLFILI